MPTRSTAVFATHVAVLAFLVTALAVCGVTPAHSAEQRADSGTLIAWVPLEYPAAQEPTADPSPESTPARGPRIEPGESERATEEETQTKAIMAAVAFALLVIVILGRRARKKSKPGW